MSTIKTFTFTTKVLVHPGGGWYVVVLPKKESAQLRNIKTARKDSWGHIPVAATIGKTTWETALWPKPEKGLYLLVIKKPIRKAEHVLEGDTVRITITPA